MKALVSLVLTASLYFYASIGFAANTYPNEQYTSFTAAEIDQMVAPIALYPDTLLTHILIASTYPLEVVQANRWAQANRRLNPESALRAVEHKTWDPSVKALVPFPDILAKMNDDLDWTQSLGDAFLADEGFVMDRIQYMRQKAYSSGYLKDNQYARIQRQNDIIVIEPAQERIVYVPYYDSRVVYGAWWWNRYPPVYWQRPSNHYVEVDQFYWGPSITLSTSFFFGAPAWSSHRIMIINDYQRVTHYYRPPQIVQYHAAQHWQHNTLHRHNIAYRSEVIHRQYRPQENYRPSRFERHAQSRDGASGGNDRFNRNTQNVPFNNTNTRTDRFSRENAQQRDNTQSRGFDRNNVQNRSLDRNSRVSREPNSPMSRRENNQPNQNGIRVPQERSSRFERNANNINQTNNINRSNITHRTNNDESRETPQQNQGIRVPQERSSRFERNANNINQSNNINRSTITHRTNNNESREIPQPNQGVHVPQERSNRFERNNNNGMREMPQQNQNVRIQQERANRFEPTPQVNRPDNFRVQQPPERVESTPTPEQQAPAPRIESRTFEQPSPRNEPQNTAPQERPQRPSRFER